MLPTDHSTLLAMVVEAIFIAHKTLPFLTHSKKKGYPWDNYQRRMSLRKMKVMQGEGSKLPGGVYWVRRGEKMWPGDDIRPSKIWTDEWAYVEEGSKGMHGVVIDAGGEAMEILRTRKLISK